ncbi:MULTISPECIES: HNH endonuclease signature motif containing protein [unclassified Wenzhouxiangella]|uniref:HNH endonuclease signature motif containing protein n=1 Tax=unclassified Wenzhouxiangella TaxID=2613841 RepID=UPI000E328718|nr:MULTISPECIES: HNH endonuclease signature motif containing protein [unclassified Wenzhouxiangella]RFF26887.1 HNH endonuclease [Wenzhouxiangella sp. 15181]RFP68458.1 HNH endonuclease [Wenzhouxiangella sp. 15190]
MALTTPITPTLPQSEIRQLEDRITELAAHIHAANYRLLTLIRQFDEAAGWAEPDIRSCAHWLNWKCGIGLNAAREKIRVAHALGDLPRISASFAKGEISYSKVRAVTRVATPENEEFLLMIALHGTASHVERAVRQYRRAKRNEALEAENDRHERRRVIWRMDEDGSFLLHGRFTPEQGERIMKAVDAAMDETEAEHRDVSAETSPEPDMNKPLPCPIEQRRADALERLSDAFLSGNQGTVSGGDRCTVHVHTDVDTLREDGEGAESTLENAGNVSAETSRRLACDCGVVPWTESGDGETLDVGRKTRSIPPAIRRVLQRRDGGCRFPGCTAHKYVDAHHIIHWADGGETKVDNLVTLCRHHHRAVHEGGFGVRMGADGQPEFTDRHGRYIPEAPKPRFRGNAFALMTQNRRAGVDVSAETCVPAWDGEPMDDDLVVEVLYQMESARTG